MSSGTGSSSMSFADPACQLLLLLLCPIGVLCSRGLVRVKK